MVVSLPTMVKHVLVMASRRLNEGGENMKLKTVLILALMLAASATTYRIYDANQVVMPKYIVRPRPDGSQAVYDSRQIVIPKYIIKPNYDGSSSVYKAGKPVLPVYRIEKRGK